MRNILNAVIATVISMSLFSCNEARYPIDEKPVVKTDARLVGKWKIYGKKDNVVYTVSKRTDETYLVTVAEKKAQPDEHIAYLSYVNNSLFFNLHSKDEEGDKYVFLRILSVDANGSKARAASIADTTMKALNSSREVRERITTHIDDPVFYSDTVTFIKIK